MASFDDVARLALALPETDEHRSYGAARAWRVRKKLFVWERPLRTSDLEALGDAAPDGPVLGAKVEHLVAKDAVLADPSGTFFTTPHFDGHAIVLAQLDRLDDEALGEVVTEAWLAAAPPRLAQTWLAERG